MTQDAIDRFAGDYHFLSNFYEFPITHKGRTFGSSEAAYQSEKCKYEHMKDEFIALTPGQSKRLGRKLPCLDEWDRLKIGVMRRIIRKKFKEKKLRKWLLATGDAELIEGNTWGDRFWGVCNGVGENHLGKVLMAERARIRRKLEKKRGKGKDRKRL